jgi:hypothetical protein
MEAIKRIAIMGFVAACSLSTAGCAIPWGSCGPDSAGISTCRLTGHELEGRPQSELGYPGATLIGRRERDQESGLDNAVDAAIVTSWSVSESASAVTSWYRSRLLAAGRTAAQQGPTTFVFRRPPREVVFVEIVSMGSGTTTVDYTYSVTPG